MVARQGPLIRVTTMSTRNVAAGRATSATTRGYGAAHYRSAPFYIPAEQFKDYAPAFCLEIAARIESPEVGFDDRAPLLGERYASARVGSRLSWTQDAPAAFAARQRARPIAMAVAQALAVDVDGLSALVLTPRRQSPRNGLST